MVYGSSLDGLWVVVLQVKRIDFRADRSLHSIPSDPLYEPSLETLLRGPAIGGPLEGSKVEAPAKWNGVVGRGSNKKPYPGRYVYTSDRRWVWEENPISKGS
jgi:hypothetical protein